MAHQEQLAEANKKVLELEREKLRIDEELKAWKMIRDGYLAIHGKTSQPAKDKIGPTEAMRVILSQHPEGLTSMQIRDQLNERGVKVGSGKYYMANVLTLLKRDPRVERVQVLGGKIYRLRKDAPE
jgi:hypothetical protein